MKRRKKHKASILQEKGSPCYLCMKMRPHYEWKRAVHEHHIFGGSNRDKSEAEGLKVYLCLEHHISGKEAVHNNAEMMKVLRQDGQRAFECGKNFYPLKITCWTKAGYVKQGEIENNEKD